MRKKSIITEAAGLYLLINQINGKIYVGKANNLRKRIVSHAKSEGNNTKKPSRIMVAIKKHKWINFKVIILREYDEIDINYLLELESEWIIKLNSTNGKIGYNSVAYSNDMTGTKASPETREKMSKALKGKYTGERSASFGRIKSQETLEKTAQSRIKNRQNAIENNLPYNNMKEIYQIDLQTNEIIKKWPSIITASRELGIKKHIISRICLGQKKKPHSFHWEYVSGNTRDFKDKEL